MSNVLIVGRRSACYRAAIKLGHKVFLWSSQVLHESRKEKLAGWIEMDFELCADRIPDEVIETARSFSLDYVVAATESSVMLAAGIRERLALPGTTVAVAEIAHNKFVMKTKAIEHDIPITPFHLVNKVDTPEHLVSELGLPLVLKPVDESGATDVKIARNKEDIARYMAPGLLAEAFVAGTEVSVETFVFDGQPLFHNITDYLHQWKKSIAPASLDAKLSEQILAINDKVIHAFGIKNGMTHAEFYLTENGPVFGEIAVRPPGGYYMELIERAYRFDPWETYVSVECGELPPKLPEKASRFAAVYMIHPGEGMVVSISGADEVSKLPGVFEYSMNLEVGDNVADHVNTSNEVGHVLLWAKTREKILADIDFIETNLKIELSN